MSNDYQDSSKVLTVYSWVLISRHIRVFCDTATFIFAVCRWVLHTENINISLYIANNKIFGHVPFVMRLSEAIQGQSFWFVLNQGGGKMTCVAIPSNSTNWYPLTSLQILTLLHKPWIVYNNCGNIGWFENIHIYHCFSGKWIILLLWCLLNWLYYYQILNYLDQKDIHILLFVSK